MPVRHRGYVRYLLAHVIKEQRWGIPEVAPRLALGKQAAIERLPHLWNPTDVEIVEDAGFNASPIVDGHGGFS